MKTSANQQRGFSLVEMMTALAIIAILLAMVTEVVLPAYLNFKRETEVQRGELSFTLLQGAIRMVANDQDTYANICEGGKVVVASPSPTTQWAYTCVGSPGDATYEVQAIGDCPAGGAAAVSYQEYLKQPACGFTLDYKYLGAGHGAVESMASVPPGWVIPAKSCWTKDKDGGCANAN